MRTRQRSFPARARWSAFLPACVFATACAASAAEPPTRTGQPQAPGPLVIEKTLTQLESADWMLQSGAIALLAEWKTPEAISPLTAMLNAEKEPWRVGAALVGLARISGSNVLARAAALSEHPAPEVRSYAAEALGIIGGKVAIEAVRRRLADADASVRYRAAAVYAMLRGKETWVDVAGLLERPPAEVLDQAARALGYIATAESRTKIGELLATNDVARQSAVLWGLKDTRDPDVVPLILKFFVRLPARSEMAGPCMELLQSYGGDFLSGSLVAAFESGDADVFVAACQLLYAHPAAEPTAALAAAMDKLKDPSDELVLAALNALSTDLAGPARHRDLYARYLTHRNGLCRARAVACLGLCGDADLFRILRESLADPDSRVVCNALLALSKMPAKAVPTGGIVAYLDKALQHNDGGVLRLAVALVASHGKPEEFPRAMEAMDPLLKGKDYRIRAQAMSTLAELGGEEGARQVAAAQGYLLDWMLIGTFLNDEHNSGFTNAYPPETEIDFKTNYLAQYVWTGLDVKNVEDKRATRERRVGWQEWTGDQPDGRVLVHNVMPPPAYLSVAYGVSDVAAPASVTVSVVVGASDPFLLWLNGSRAAEATNRGTAWVEFPATLHQGQNRFMIKSCNLRGEWWYSVQIREKDAAGGR